MAQKNGIPIRNKSDSSKQQLIGKMHDDKRTVD